MQQFLIPYEKFNMRARPAMGSESGTRQRVDLLLNLRIFAGVVLYFKVSAVIIALMHPYVWNEVWRDATQLQSKSKCVSRGDMIIEQFLLTALARRLCITVKWSVVQWGVRRMRLSDPAIRDKKSILQRLIGLLTMCLLSKFNDWPCILTFQMKRLPHCR